MTSPSHSSLGFSASAEQSSEHGTPLLVHKWSSDDSRVASGPLSLRNSLPDGSAYIRETAVSGVSALPAPRVHFELPEFLRAECAVGSRSPLVKRISPPIVHCSLKSHCDTGILQQLPSLTKSSTGVHSSQHHASKRASSRARASASGGPRTVSDAHGFHVGRRTPERPYKDFLRSSDLRVNDEGEVAMSVTSANPRTTALFEGAQARPPFESVGLDSSSDSSDDTGASVPNSPSVVGPSPSFSAREPCDSYLSTGPLSAHLRNPFSSPLSSTTFTPWSPIEPSPSSSSLGSLYGSPGVPIPRPPYQILPTPHALVSQQNTPQPSIEADGYTIIRNAVSPALVREVVASIYKGLPVTARYETEKIYTTPITAYKVRDEFVLVCHSSSFQSWN